MSGATVFSGNNIIVGVITEHHLPEGESTLTVVPITALDLLPEAEATKWWKLLGVNHRALVRLPGEEAPSSLSHAERQNRTRLMKRVRETWIYGLLEHSLHQAALIDLHLQEQPNALDNPWHLQVQEFNRAPRPLPTGTSIVQVYDEADGELLILGEPGAGKTTLLLELARTLLDRAEADVREHLPVIFNLSSWAEKCLPLSDWLVKELQTKYQIPRTLGNTWVATGQILPLLDGLDEVAENVRPRCVQVINSYYQQRLEEEPVPLVVCCRSREYMALPTRVTLHQAVSIEPLTDIQIVLYLQSAGYQLEALRHTLRNDPALYELAHRPLMLSIFTLAYQGATSADLPTKGTLEARRRHIFATYVERMLARRGIPKSGSREQMMHWLAFLARRMQQYHQMVFYLESMRPSWLGGRYKHFLYRLSIGLLGGLIIGLLDWLVDGLVDGPVDGLIYGSALGLIIGLLLGGVSMTNFAMSMSLSPNQVIWQTARRGLRIGLVAGLVAGPLFGSSLGLVLGLLDGLVAGLLFGLVFGLGGFLTTAALP